jgi:hypothetical protein
MWTLHFWNFQNASGAKQAKQFQKELPPLELRSQLSQQAARFILSTPS